jgi:hypothetical protein
MPRLDFLLMLRTCSCIIASIVTITVGSVTAQAADTTLTLACKGTVTETMMGQEKIPEPISTGIILNVTSQTVQGFGTPVNIIAWVCGGALSNERDVIVRFSEDNKSSEATFIGSYRPLDRHS